VSDNGIELTSNAKARLKPESLAARS